jgi:hypothetical protein
MRQIRVVLRHEPKNFHFAVIQKVSPEKTDGLGQQWLQLLPYIPAIGMLRLEGTIRPRGGSYVESFRGRAKELECLPNDVSSVTFNDSKI